MKNDGLRRLDAELAGGTPAGLREAVLALSADERALLEEELGSETLDRVFATARRRARSKLGRVVLLNGIMGASLDVVKRGDRDHVWIHYLRLLQGRIADLELAPDGVTPVRPGVRVEVAGLHRKTYLALALELDTHWDCLQLAYDWRQDIRTSAQRLGEKIASWSGGDPVHLLAHSMGGLVARSFVSQHPELWKQLAGPDLRAGGRLVMLGTPNHGSYAIPLMLTGEEKLVRQLAMLDASHGKKALLRIVATFPGGFQMLPSPHVPLDDDHAKLYETAPWGALPITKGRLQLAAKLHDELRAVRSPERMLYVAGYDQSTPHRIRIVAPGRFEYRTTRAGDGRVPHELGLLPQVTTRWVREIHGDLPRNRDVLEGIHELLETGDTSLLESSAPVGLRSVESGGWIAPEELLPPGELEEFERLAKKLRAERAVRSSAATSYDEDAARLIALLGDDLLGSASPVRGSAERARKARRVRTRPVTMQVEVVWGDITRVVGDVYCVGHYQGVLPQRAELALDRVVSFERRERTGARAKRPSPTDPRFVLRSLTQRGVLKGELGEITLFPWAGKLDRHKSVAIAGMGHPGAFNVHALRRLAESLAWTVGKLPGRKTICTVLIGSGEGTLSVEDSVRGLMQGVADAIRAGLEASVPLLRIVEQDRGRARRIREALLGMGDEAGLRMRVRARTAEGGRIAEGEALAHVLAAAAVQLRARGKGEASAALLRRIRAEHGLRTSAREAVSQLASRRGGVEALACAIDVTIDPEEKEAPRSIPSRISFVRQGRGVKIAAIDDRAVVPERTLGVDFALIEELCERAIDPPIEQLPALASSVRRRLVPEDFLEHLGLPSPKVFEVDRDTAIVPWEALPSTDGEQAGDHLGLRYPVARQLRTAYSSPPSTAAPRSGALRALVVGDPGDPRTGDDLPGAREEAERVVRLLRERGVEVVSRLGAPRRRVAWGRDGGPATRLEVLHLLDREAFDVLHYSGQGDFDPEDPSSTGWLFADGLLTAADLATAGRLPRLVVANACLSSRTSRRLQGKLARDAAQSDAALLPSLADEFLRRGVRNYVGTAWEVSDEGAIVFAEVLYRRLLPELPERSGEPLGDAVLAARKAVAERADAYGALWLAYQLYGDPDFRLSAESGF